MSRPAILFVLLTTTAAGSAACSAAPAVDEELLAEDQVSSLAVGEPSAPTAPKCPLYAFDFALTPDDTRTCASFTFTTKAGRWTSGYTFATAPSGIRERRCHVAFRSTLADCTKPDQADLKLNCKEALSFAPAKSVVTTPGIRFDSSPSSIKPNDVPLACNRAYLPSGGMSAMSYTGGCTSCGSIFGNTLFVNFPLDVATVTYWDNMGPHSISFWSYGAPIQYTLPNTPNAAAGVVVSD